MAAFSDGLVVEAGEEVVGIGMIVPCAGGGVVVVGAGVLGAGDVVLVVVTFVEVDAMTFPLEP